MITDDADDAELRAAVVAEPDDDDARAVYGDVLLGRGDPRGELIAVQRALAELERRGADDDPAWPALRRRELGLLAAHQEQWLAAVAGYGAAPMRLGFVDALRASTADVDALAAMLDREPIARLILDVDDPAATAELVERGALRRLRALRLVGDRDLRGHVEQLTAAALPALVELGGARGAGAAILARLDDELAARLHRLDLRAQPPGDLRDVATCFPALRWLGVDVGGDEDDSLPEVLAALPALRGLELIAAPLGDADAARLAGALPPLDELRVHAARLGVAGLHQLVTAPALQGVRDLALTWRDQPHAASVVAAGVPGLERLDLGRTEVNLAALVAAPWPRLRSLALRSPGGTALRHLDRVTWPALRHLALRSLDAVVAGLGAAVAAAPDLRGLTRLELHGIDDDGVVALARAGWPVLHTLVLHGAQLGDVGALVLAGADAMPALVDVYLRPSSAPGPLTHRGRDALRARFGLGLHVGPPARKPWPADDWFDW